MNRDTKGFTLTELLTVIAIFFVLGFTIAVFFFLFTIGTGALPAQGEFWSSWGIGSGLMLCVAGLMCPRITMFALWCASTGGIGALAYPGLAVIGWVIAPRITLAILTTAFYWVTNPVLCVIAWVLFLGGEGGEKSAATRMGSE